MPANRKTSYQALIAGRKGQGKTTMVDALARGRRYAFVFDLKGEYDGKGFTTVNSMQEIKQIVRKRWRKGYRIAFRPKITTAVAQLEEMTRVICEIHQPYYDTPDDGTPLPMPKALFIVEEMRWSYPAHVSATHRFAELCTLGRHYGVDIIGTTQRIAEISNNFRGTCDVRFFFAQDDGTDIATIGKMIGRQHLPALAGLRPHQYLRYYANAVTLGQNRLR